MVRTMAMTPKVKDELARLDITKPVLPQGGGGGDAALRRRAAHRRGRIVVEAELDTAMAARRLRTFIAEVYGHHSDLVVLPAVACARAAAISSASSRRAPPWPGRPASSMRGGTSGAGLPAKVVSAGSCDSEAAWRGASSLTAR